ncbi:hypothetical protein ACWEPM_16090 [Streptomyces sp. NPDC004244]
MSERNSAARQQGVPEAVERVLAAEVSLGSRLRHVAVGLAGGCAAALIGVLWATEPDPLPARTRAAFAGLIAVGLAWAAFAGWALTGRRPLFVRDRVLAARLALAVAVVTAVAGTALAAARADPAAALATALAGAAVVAAAGLVLLRARARSRALLRLREALRQQDAPRTPMGSSSTSSGAIATVKETAVKKKTAPVGPLAHALRLRGAGGRTVFLVVALSCAALLAGLVLLLT